MEIEIKASRTVPKTDPTSGPGYKTLPQRYFTSEEIFTRETERLFSSQWVCVGHQSQIANRGDYFLQHLGSESLIILRDRKGDLRAFYNVCRHRGARLCEAPGGHLRKTLQCPYHAWTYRLDGKLVGAPHMDQVPGFNKTDHSLRSVNVGAWEGFVFLNLDNHPVGLEKIFSPLAGKFSGWNLPNLRSATRITYEVHANWKLIFENYSE